MSEPPLAAVLASEQNSQRAPAGKTVEHRLPVGYSDQQSGMLRTCIFAAVATTPGKPGRYTTNSPVS
jgi:hypothetical protein